MTNINFRDKIHTKMPIPMIAKGLKITFKKTYICMKRRVRIGIVGEEEKIEEEEEGEKEEEGHYDQRYIHINI